MQQPHGRSVAAVADTICMRFDYCLEQHWPVQAWLAQCHPRHVLVRHGGRVETRDDWFCEAVWDGEIERGDFDLTDIVAGSGARIRDGRFGLHRDLAHHYVCSRRDVADGEHPDPRRRHDGSAERDRQPDPEEPRRRHPGQPGDGRVVHRRQRGAARNPRLRPGGEQAEGVHGRRRLIPIRGFQHGL